MPIEFDELDLNKAFDDEQLVPDQMEFEPLIDPVERTKVNIGQAMEFDPDQHASDLKLSRESGLDVNAVQTGRDAVQKRIQFDQLNLDAAFDKAPATVKFINTNPDNAIMAQDDINIMSEVEGVLNWYTDDYLVGLADVFRSVPSGAVQGVSMSTSGAGNILEMMNRNVARGLDAILPEGADKYLYMQEDTPALLQHAAYADPSYLLKYMGTGGKQIAADIGAPVDRQNIATDIAGAVGQMIPQIATAIVTPQVAIPMLFSQGVDQQAARQEETGTLGQNFQSDLALLTGGAITAGSEKMGLDAILDRVPPKIKNDIARKIVDLSVAGGIEAVQEVVEGVSHSILEYATTNPDAEIFEGLDREAIAAGGAGAIMRGLLTSLVPGRARDVSDDIAWKNNVTAMEQHKLDQLNALIPDSELKRRDPESFRQFIAEADNDSSVYIDGAQTALYLQQKSRDEIEADPALKMLSDQATEAASLGGDVVVPMADFATDFAGTEHFDALRPGMTLSAETVAPFRQEQAQQENDTFIRNIVAEAEGSVSEYTQAQDIFNSVRDQLIDTGRVSPQQASFMSQVVPAYFTVHAKRNGKTVEQVYAESGLTIEGPMTGEMARLSDEALQQYSDDVNLEKLIAEFDELFPEGTQQDASQYIFDSKSIPERQRRLLESTGLDQDAAWTDERLDANLRTAYDGSTDNRVAFINPADFVNSTHPDPQVIEDEAGDLDLERMQDESQTPFLWIGDQGEIVGHEGRHRMAALNKAGVTRVPIQLRFMAGTNIADTVDESRSYQVKGQEFDDGRGVDLNIDESYLAVPENRDVIKQAMGQPELMFQPAPTRIENDDAHVVTTGKPVTFNYQRNPESATKLMGLPDKDSPFERGIEPSGEYMTIDEGFAPDSWETGTVTFNNPLVLPSVDDDGASWKQKLTEQYDGKTGKELSKAVIADGYDGIITTQQKYIGEIVNFNTFDESKALFQSGDRNLVVTHNLSAENILAAADLGGLAAPSIATVRSDISDFDSFGEVSLLADPSLLESAKARTFDADVYSPRQPRATYDIDVKKFNGLYDQLDPEGYGLSKPDINSMEDSSGAENLQRSTAVQYMWLQEQGKAPKLKKKKVDPVIKKAQKLMQTDGIRDAHDLSRNDKFQKMAKQHYDKMLEQVAAADEGRVERYRGFWFDENGDVLPRKIIDLAHEVDRYNREDGLDIGQLRNDINKKFRVKKTQGEYDSWVTDLFNSMVKGKELFKGYTPSGNSKYVDYNMQNVVKEMTQQLQGGEASFYGAGSIRSTYANELKSVEKVKQNRDKIVSEDEMSQIKEDSAQVLEGVLDKLKPFYKFDADSWGYAEDAGQAMMEGRKGINEAFDTSNPEVMEIITDFTEYLAALPSSYFETKIQRPVEFSEFNTAVVPKGMRKDAVQVLRDAGLKIKTYDPSGEGKTRQQVIAEQERLLFQESQQTARGYYDPANSMIRLTESSDLSTFLHEFAHFMYEMELTTGGDTVQQINSWFKRNAEDVAAEANGYIGDQRDVVEQEGVTVEERKQRAREQGFDVDQVWYHGSPAQVEIETLLTGDETFRRHGNAFGDGVYITTSVDTANEFAREGQVIQLYRRGNMFKPDGLRLDDDVADQLDAYVRENFNEGDIAKLVGDIGTERKSIEIADKVEAQDFFKTQKDNWEFFRGLDRTKPQVKKTGDTFTIEYIDFNAAPTFKGKTKNETVNALIHVSGKAAGDALGAVGFDGIDYTAGEAVIFNPADVRSVNAEFDPARTSDRDLLAQGDTPTAQPGSITADKVVEFLDLGTTGNAAEDAAIRRAVHEQFARGFEEYLMEGKAPSIEMRNAFRTFARWLSQIYSALRRSLNVNLDDEMRAVFDRLLATEEQIAAAESRARIEPLFTDAALAGMTEAEFQDYQRQVQKPKEAASETLRDKLIKQLTRQTESWWKEEKSDIIDEQITELEKQQVYRARDNLRTGDIKLDHAIVKEMVGETVTDKRGRTSVRIPASFRGMTVKGGEGVHPDQAGAFFDYTSGSEMLNDLMTAAPIKDVAVANAEAIMIERHGDILTDGSIEQEADAAVQNEERGKLLLRELKVLNRGAPTQRSIDIANYKDMAVERIGQLNFREINPGKYRKAEVNAAAESARMMAEGNREGAAAAKQRQIANHYLAVEAANARNETMKIVDRMGRYRKKAVREAIQKAGNEYWEQLVKILGRFEFRKSATLRDVEQVNTDINTWVRTRVEEDGAGLSLSNAVLNELYTTHWKNVPYADLQGVNDSVKNIEHVARYSNKITLMEDEIQFERLRDQWVDQIKANGQKFTNKQTRSRVDDIAKEGFSDMVRRWASQLTKIPFLASWLDGGERAGMSHDILMRRLTEALDNKLTMMDEVARPVFQLIEGRTKEDVKRHLREIYIPEINDNLTGAQIVSVALNTGNAGNLRKLLLGEGWANPDNDAEINFENPKLQAILAHMNAADWRMVQTIWDQMDTLYPQLAEVHRRTTGLAPPKVDATPFTVEVDGESIDMKGGYYPVKYSRKRSHKAEKNAEKRDAEVESMFNNTASIQASVNAGATNERTGFYDRIQLNLDVVTEHFNEVIHYITHHDTVRQINRLIQDPSVADAITASVGEAEFNQLKPWLNDVAKDGRGTPAKSFIDEAFQRLRFGVTLGAMGFKASTGIMQVFGLFTTAAELGTGPTVKAIKDVIGTSWYMKAVRRSLGSTEDVQSAWDFAVEKSKVLKHRTDTMDREIRNALERLQGKKGKLAAVQEASMKHIALIQTYMVDLPTWIAAYDKTISETGDEVKAVSYADWAVENLQGSGATKDMATLMRSQTKLQSTFTMFMTFFSSLGNLTRELGRGQFSTGEIAAKSMFLFTLPVFFEMLMRGDLDEPEDEDERLQKYATAVATYPLTSVPFVRDAVSGLVSDYGYNITPVASLIERGIQGARSIADDVIEGDDITKSAVKNLSKLGGAAAGIPGVNQAWASSEHLYEVISEGEDFTTREFLFGPDR